MFQVDVLTVLAPGECMRPEALAALSDQGAVHLRHHQEWEPRRAGENRYQAIARARNQIKQWGQSPYLLFLDRDVVLPQGGIERLVLWLLFNPGYAGIGFNYQDPAPTPAPHVALGATLFVRGILERFSFRAAAGQCECACLCTDLRAAGYQIDYFPGYRATHVGH